MEVLWFLDGCQSTVSVWGRELWVSIVCNGFEFSELLAFLWSAFLF